MKILYWGTPEFAVPPLRALDDEGFDVVGVVTQPDRPAGRGRQLRPSIVKETALELGIPVLTPDTPRGEEFLESIRALEPDISVVVAYGHILTPEVLDLPPLGSINVHASLLPELRGAAPIHWAIARGHEETGITIMRMTEGMDEGPIIHQVVEPILEDETGEELTIRLSEVGAAALVEGLALLTAGAVEEVEQDHDAATYAPKIDRETARIDWTRSADDVAQHVRAMDSVPGAWTYLNRAPVKLFRPTVLPERVDPEPPPSPEGNGGKPVTPETIVPGFVLRTHPGLVVATGEGHLLFAEVHPPGKQRMRAPEWVRGGGVEPGQRFE